MASRPPRRFTVRNSDATSLFKDDDAKVVERGVVELRRYEDVTRNVLEVVEYVLVRTRLVTRKGNMLPEGLVYFGVSLRQAFGLILLQLLCIDGGIFPQ